MKIIVPTDFSELSKVAMVYAAEFASHTKDPLILVYNVILDSPPRAGMLLNIEEKMQANAIEDLQVLEKWIKTNINPAPDTFTEITRTNNSASAILQLAESKNAGLIVMGTRGASGLAGTILGSVSADVIRRSSIPVLLIPSDSKFSTEGRMVFAIDPGSPAPENTIRNFYHICQKFEKTPEFIFAGSLQKENEIAAATTLINSSLQGVTSIFHASAETNPVTAINNFNKENKCMVIALAPNQHSFFDRILGKSITTRMVADATVPILTLP